MSLDTRFDAKNGVFWLILEVDADTISLGVFKDEDEALAWVTETQIDP